MAIKVIPGHCRQASIDLKAEDQDYIPKESAENWTMSKSIAKMLVEYLEKMSWRLVTCSCDINVIICEKHLSHWRFGF
jgi:hypothetical protein